MGIDFFYLPQSAPCRSVWMTLKTLGLDFEEKLTDIFKGETHTPEYLKMNPRGKVPTIKDGDYVLGESRAIATYLCNQYEKGDDSTRLYPVDPKKRGLVDQMLYVSENTSDMIQSYVNTGGVLFGGEGPCEQKVGEVHKALNLCEGFLTKNKYMAGNHPTLADIFMMSPIVLLDCPGFKDWGKYPRTTDWLSKMKELPHYNDCFKKGVGMFNDLYQEKLRNRKA